MKNLTILFAFLLAVPAFSENARIAGTIRNSGTEYATLHYYETMLDRIFFEHRIDTVTLDQEGNFVFDLDLEHPVEFFIKSGRKYVTGNRFIEPGDTFDIRVSFLGRGMMKDIDADWTAANFFLYEFSLKYYADDAKVMEYDNSFSKDLQAFTDYIDLRRKQQLDFLDEFQHKMIMTDAFKTHIIAEIDYMWAIDRLQYLRRYPELTGKMPEIEDSYFEQIETIGLNNPKPLSNTRYPLLLQTYLRERYEYEVRESRRSRGRVFAANFGKMKLASEILGGEALDIACAALLREQISAMLFIRPESDSQYRSFVKATLEYAAKMIELFDSISTDRKYFERCSDYLEEARSLSPGMAMPDFSLNDLEGGEVSIYDFKGKPLFIDFWSMTCAPCLKAFPKIRELQSEFSDRNIVFIFISLDSDPVKVKDFVEDNDIRGVHLIAPGGFGSEAAKKYKIKAIPHYSLVDKLGRIFNANAPGPDQQQQLLQKLIEIR